MLTSKQRAYLRKHAHPLDICMHVGKQGVTPELVAGLDEALEARELIKIGVLANCETAPADVAELVAGRARADCVQVIGRKIVLFRPSKTKPGIILPK